MDALIGPTFEKGLFPFHFFEMADYGTAPREKKRGFLVAKAKKIQTVNRLRKKNLALFLHQISVFRGRKIHYGAPSWILARWQNGYVADCKSVYAGSIPARASITMF